MAIDLDALIRAVRSNPEARDTLRRELLTEELLGLPGLVAQLTTRMDQLAVQMGQLAAAQVRTEERLSEVKTITKRADGRVGDLWGKQYEARALRTPFHVEDAIGADPGTVRPVSAAELEALLNPAVVAGALPREERAALGDANGIFVWDRGPGAAPVYCVVEISATVDAHDVERAAQRAAWLAKTGVATRPVVMGDVVVPDAQPALDAQRVAWQRVPVQRRHKFPTF